MIWWRTGRRRARDRIGIWLRQLAWAAAGHGRLEATAVWWEQGAWESAEFPPPDDAREQLGRWLDAWWQGLAAPLSFFPETSFAFAKAVASVPDDGDAIPGAILEAAREKAYVAWLGNPFRPGPAEGSDLYLALVHDAGRSACRRLRGPRDEAPRPAREGPAVIAGESETARSIRVRFASLRGALVRNPMDSRLRGNDINCIFAVIPAKAGIHAAYPNTNAAGQ